MTSATATTPTQEVIAAARSGDGPALATVRGWMGKDIARASPHIFRVEDIVLIDTSVDGPRVRAEVFAPVTPFGHRDPLWQGRSTRRAIADVKNCPPLARWFQSHALAHMAALERRLILETTLDAPARRKLHREIQLLAAPGRPAWENWVYGTPDWRLDVFDRLVAGWMQAPVDFSEEAHFKTGWDQNLYAMASAGALFNTLDPRVRDFFGIKVVWVPEPDFPSHAAGLHLEPHEANRLAELLGVEFRFECA